MTTTETPANGLPETVESLRAILYNVDDVRALMPKRTDGTEWPTDWILKKFKALGLRPRFMGDQRLWLKADVEGALPKLVRAEWKKAKP